MPDPDAHVLDLQVGEGLQVLIKQPSLEGRSRAGHLPYFLIFSIKEIIFLAFFIKLIRLGVDFLNRNGAEIGYTLQGYSFKEIGTFYL